MINSPPAAEIGSTEEIVNVFESEINQIISKTEGKISSKSVLKCVFRIK